MSIPPQHDLARVFLPLKPHVRLLLKTAHLTITLTLVMGCARRPPPATVEGTLRLNGKPLDNCLITFLPERGQGANQPHSSGLADEHGSYRLRFDNQQEGAAMGWHRVTIQDLSVSTGIVRRDHGKVDQERDENTPPPPVRRSRVPAHYTSPNDTPLRKEVKAGHQVIELDIPVKGS